METVYIVVSIGGAVLVIFTLWCVWISRRYIDYRLIEYVREEGIDIALPKYKKPRIPKLFRKSLDKQARFLAVCAEIEGFFAAQNRKKKNK